MNYRSGYSSTLLDIDSITLSYGDKTVLNDFSLTLKEGEKIIIAGPNGSGKTTLLKAILGLIRPAEGRIRKKEGLKISYTRQGECRTLSPISVKEVVSMGLYRSHSKDAERVENAMKRTGVNHLSCFSFSSLSGGERQRVQIARSITQEADIILMDEPTTFLDTSFREELADILSLLPSSMAAVIVTHDEDLVEKLGWSVIRIGEEAEACRG